MNETADSDRAEQRRLRDEIEQLRTSLESSIEENTRLTEDRDRLLRRVTALAREIQAMQPPAVDALLAEREDDRGHSGQTEEALRVAFEELQVMTEELEVANTSLHEQNLRLDERVRERTAEISIVNETLRKSEAALQIVTDLVPDLLWRADADGLVTWYSKRWYDYTGQSVEEALGTGWTGAVHPDDRGESRALWEIAVAQAIPYQREHRIRSHTGECRRFLVRAVPQIGKQGRVGQWFGAITDIDDLSQLRDRQQVLVAELQHRTRNLMAVVQAVTQRTLKGSVSLDDFKLRIDDRLGALSRAQSLLSRRTEGMKVRLVDLLAEELGAHMPTTPDGEAQIRMSGDEGVTLRSGTVQTFALAIHELATNAIKYGALSIPTGHLDVVWTVDRVDDRPRLRLEWRESGVPDMASKSATSRPSGYGRELIERALPYQLGCRTSFAFTEDGVLCMVDMPMGA
jgi:PAS domain S-box-containing protein